MTQIGLFFGALAVVRSLFQAVGGEISDRIERQLLLNNSQYIRAIAFLFLAISIYFHWGFWMVAGFMLLNSIFGAIFMSVSNALVSDILPRQKRLDGYAITRAAGNLGWAAGPAIGGFLATSSYALLFLISAGLTLISGVIFQLFMRAPSSEKVTDRFSIKDLIAIKDDPMLAAHVGLLFLLYLVVAQLIVPFSVFTVDTVGISKTQLGYLFTLNGLLVVVLQIPVTRLLSRFALTTQLSIGAFLYAIGYGIVGMLTGYHLFIIAIIIVTFGEVFMSPPSLTLTSQMAPPKRIGRYMGIQGFFVSAGWSLGPLYGGVILDNFKNEPVLAWITISSIAVLSSLGYMWLKRKLPHTVDYKE